MLINKYVSIYYFVVQFGIDFFHNHIIVLHTYGLN